MRIFKIIIFFISISVFSQKAKPFKTPFEIGNKNQTTTYNELQKFYEELDTFSDKIKVIEKGLTDSGNNLQIIVFSEDKNFDFNQNKTKILINNGIHPGEPDGIDASMQFLRNLAIGKIIAPKNTLVIVIPVYNIGGMLNRNSTSRTNQNGPEEYGFRGNARNFDLNRDFIKSDTKNSRSFQEIVAQVQPDVFIDNHVSNGADYQYVFTCIATQHERLGKNLGTYFNEVFAKNIFKAMQAKNIPVSPYVNVHNGTPDVGFEQFADSPRYATGYTTLFNVLGFVPETHMLKPYDLRVKATYEFMESVLKYTDANWKTIKQERQQSYAGLKAGNSYPISWEIDSTKKATIEFKGFEGSYKKSDVTQKDRLFYDRKKPFTKQIPFYADYKGVDFVAIPKYYVIPKSQWPILDLLRMNGVKLKEIKNDTVISVESYKIAEYQTTKSPYEGHYLHYNTKVYKENAKIGFFKGDYLVATDGKTVKYLLETLEPQAVDSFFNWNFMDTILQQKEYFSAYVFEELAKVYLDENLIIKEEFENKKQSDAVFKENANAQLDWIYKHSAHYEKAHLQYPIYRILN
jgi:predicted small secreted protein